VSRRFAFADVSIDAPVDVVWAVMLDLAHYPLWNPFIVRIDAPGDRAPRVGDGITLHVRFRGGRAVASRERITRIESPAIRDGVARALLEYEFAGRLHHAGLVRGRRVQRLEQNPDGSTSYHTEERFRGALAFVLSVPAIQNGFRRHARALKERAESIDVPGGDDHPADKAG
jgi:hypothetical protein